MQKIKSGAWSTWKALPEFRREAKGMKSRKLVKYVKYAVSMASRHSELTFGVALSPRKKH